jgi:hypothetical protein
MADLVGHVGGVHRWAAEMVRTRSDAPISRRGLPGPPEGAAALVAWYEEGLDQLVDSLRTTDPEAPVWNWSTTGDRAARFWHRRMALETAVHRWDAQTAAGGVGGSSATGGSSEGGPVDAVLAADGVDEYFELFVDGRLRGEAVEGLSGSLHLHATDGEGEWWIAFAPDHLERRHEHAKADAAVRGPASALLLWVWKRRPDDARELQVFGDTEVLKRLGAITF